MYGPDEEYQRGYDNGWDAGASYKEDQIQDVITKIDSGDFDLEWVFQELKKLVP